MSIKVKLTLIFIGLIAAVVICSSIVLLLFFSNATRQQIEVLLLNHAANIIPHIEEDHLNGVKPFPLNIDTTDDLIYQIWDDQGELIAGAPYAGDESLSYQTIRTLGLKDRFQEVVINQKSFQINIIPIKVDSKSGFVLVGINYSEVAKAQRNLLFSVIAIDVIASFLAGYLCWILIIEQFKKLKEITDFARNDILSKKLYLRFPLPKNVNNETRDMIIAVNQGLDRIEKMFNAQKRFLADVSHELRTPLTVLKGNIGLMRLMKKFDDESMATMEREIDRLSRLVGDLLIFAQADADEVKLNMVGFDFEELFMEVYKQIRILGGHQYNIELVDIDQAFIVGDRDRLKQVMINLGGNAIKYTPPGGTIKMGMKKAETELCFYISDKGVGIPEEDIPHIFERLYRGDKSRTFFNEENRSYGIGLAISDWIVKKHQGRIIVESVDGAGTTFRVCLPLKLKLE